MKNLELTEQDINIILQALSIVNVPVKDAPVIIDLINKIQKQVSTNE